MNTNNLFETLTAILLLFGWYELQFKIKKNNKTVQQCLWEVTSDTNNPCFPSDTCCVIFRKSRAEFLMQSSESEWRLYEQFLSVHAFYYAITQYSFIICYLISYGHLQRDYLVSWSLFKAHTPVLFPSLILHEVIRTDSYLSFIFSPALREHVSKSVT